MVKSYKFAPSILFMQKFELDEFKALDLSAYAVVDARKSELFTDGFIAASVSIPFGENFINSIQELISADVKILLVADEADIASMLRAVKNSGVSNITGYLAGGFEAWLNGGNKFDMLIGIDADEFAIDYQFDEFYLVDTRDRDEYEKGHVEDAESIALIDLEPLLVEMDTQDIYYLYGETAAEAVTAGSLLKRNGFQRVRPVTADYNAIKAAGVPMFAPKKKGNSSSQHSDD
jgi:hydroxyacylglutathione hydrolase